MKTLGGTALNKGIINNIQLVMWDAVPECNEDCPIYDTCIYAANHHNKCDLRKQYTNKVLQNLSTACAEADEIKVHKIGFLLIPLYQQLITFKINSLNNQHQIFEGNRINPIFKEQREVIKLITTMLDSLEIGDGSGRLGKHGDPQYYENFVDGEEDY